VEDIFVPDQNTRLLVAAMPSEIRHAVEHARIQESQRVGPWLLYSGELDDEPVRLLLTGIGMVNAGAALARVLSHVEASMVINFGCAGAHRSDIHPGDVVVGTRYVHHRAVTILPHGEESYSGIPVNPLEIADIVAGLEADVELLSIATQVADDWVPDPWPGSKHREARVHAGTVTSADAWTQSTEHIERIHRDLGTLCEDMEASALAQIAAMHSVPFLAIKDISNNELLAVTEHSVVGPTLDAVEEEVGKRAFNLVREILRRLG
jgi:adenosylhomocysteine nucleosidase